MNRIIEPIAPPGVHEKVFALALALPGTTVLDVPAGYGALTEKLLAAGKKVTAGDIDTGKFKGSRSHPGLTLIRLDLNETLPLPDNQFDVAVSVEGIEHLQSQWTFVRNIHRVLKPGGYLVITTPNILNIRSRLRYFMEGRYEHFKRPLVKGKSWQSDLDNYHISPVSFFELQFMLESCSLEVQNVYSSKSKARNIMTRLLKPLFSLFYANKNYRDKKRNRGDHDDLYRIIMSDEVFFGECLVVVAQKKQHRFNEHE
jgi:SAM-dependent methyltransferase